MTLKLSLVSGALRIQQSALSADDTALKNYDKN